MSDPKRTAGPPFPRRGQPFSLLMRHRPGHTSTPCGAAATGSGPGYYCHRHRCYRRRRCRRRPHPWGWLRGLRQKRLRAWARRLEPGAGGQAAEQGHSPAQSRAEGSALARRCWSQGRNHPAGAAAAARSGRSPAARLPQLQDSWRWSTCDYYCRKASNPSIPPSPVPAVCRESRDRVDPRLSCTPRARTPRPQGRGEQISRA